MTEATDRRAAPTVFISYAHESDALSDRVEDLARWLRDRGARVVTDHAHIDRPPAEGWTIWMQRCIDQADIVLVVCTPKLKQRYEKSGPSDEGAGAVFEGALVIRELYEGAMQNDKFYPVLPDGGERNNIPQVLRNWENGYHFPSGTEKIGRLVFGGEDESPMKEVGAPVRMGEAHRDLTLARLGEDGARIYLDAVCAEAPRRFCLTKGWTTAKDVVSWFSECAPNQVQELFYLVRDGLEIAGRHAAPKEPTEKAAVALYCLAACRLVDQTLAGQVAKGWILPVATAEPMICGILASSFFGGELKLLATGDSDRARPRHVLVLDFSRLEDQLVPEFERHLSWVLLGNDRETTKNALKGGMLSDEEREKLAARIRTIRFRQRQALALVMPNLHLEEAEIVATGSVAKKIPILLPDTPETERILGMKTTRLLAEIGEFWRELESFGQTHTQAAPPPRSTSAAAGSGDSPHTEGDGGQSIHVQTSGDVQIITNSGPNATLLTGSGHQAYSNNPRGGDLEVLRALLREIAAAIEEPALADFRQMLAAKLQPAQQAVKSNGKPDGGRVQGALRSLEAVAKGLTNGDKIIALIAKAYAALAPFCS